MKIKILISLAMLSILVAFGRAQTVITTDSVAGEWSAGSSPYIITRDIFIPHDTSLIIKPGTEIRFAGNYAIRVDGKLRATGTKKDKIIFAYADSAELAECRTLCDTTSANINGWKGIRFSKNRPENDTSILAYCIIKEARALTGAGFDCTGGGVSILGPGEVIIKNCLISNNRAHIGAAIYCEDNNAIIDGNLIEKNQSLSNGGAICLINCRPALKNNLIRFNTSPEFGGGVYCDKTGGTFVNNTFVENRARFGGAISLVKSNIRMLNNTIADNHADVNGGGIHCQQSSPFIKNSIVWGNEARNKGKQLYLYILGYPDIVYSNIQGGQQAIEKFSDTLNHVYNYENNLEDEPAFIKDDTAFYGLKRNSPCIDAGQNHDQLVSEGMDMNGNPRIMNNIIDMGAQEFRSILVSDKPEIKEDIIIDESRLTANIFPNPNKGKFTVEISGSESDLAFLGIVNASGQALFTQSISINGTKLNQQVELDFSRGFYFVELKNGKGEVIRREKIIIE